MRQASQKEVQIIAFPELSVTSYTCMDLFSQETLLRNAEKALLDLVNNTADLDLLTIVGCPLVSGSQLINAAVAFQRGEILGVVPRATCQLQRVPRRALVHGLFTPTAIHDHDR